MRHEINFTSEAQDDLIEIYKFVAINDSFDKAENLFNEIYETCVSLKDFPNRGQNPPELFDMKEDFLEIHYKPYRIIYTVSKNVVFVNCIIDGRRNVQELLRERLLK